MSKTSNTVMCIPDTHFPYHHKDTFTFLKAVKKEFKPNIIVHLGDLFDQHTIGRWTPDPDAYGAHFEHELASECARDLYEIFPKMSICFGNHDRRVFKEMLRNGIPRAFHKSLKTVYGLPETWRWAPHWNIAGTYFFHGDGYSGKMAQQHAAYDKRCNCVLGHVHAFAGVSFLNCEGTRCWGLNAGCLVDLNFMAMIYAKDFRYKVNQGCGIIDKKNRPHFIPLQ